GPGAAREQRSPEILMAATLNTATTAQPQVKPTTNQPSSTQTTPQQGSGKPAQSTGSSAAVRAHSGESGFARRGAETGGRSDRWRAADGADRPDLQRRRRRVGGEAEAGRLQRREVEGGRHGQEAPGGAQPVRRRDDRRAAPGVRGRLPQEVRRHLRRGGQ